MTDRKYAKIYNGEVKERFLCENYELANYITRVTYGEEAFAVDCTQCYCAMGDKYHDGTFYHVSEDGTETAIEYEPTQEQELMQLKADNAELIIALADMIGGLS